MNELQVLIYVVPAALIAIIFHEMAHGYVSYRLGDPTPKAQGRLSLNPIRHLDPFGTLMLILFNFGWAKPVRVDPSYYESKKSGMVLVALAGPVVNLLLAFISVIFMGLVLKYANHENDIYIHLLKFFNYLSIINIGLGIFNLIPIPPLDGSKVVGALLPEDMYFSYMRFEQFGFIILIILLSTNILTQPLIDFQNNLFQGMINVVSNIFEI